jgi:hypothetical protein
MIEEDDSEEIFEEKIELPQKERFKQLLLSTNLQEQLEDFSKMETTPGNIKILKPVLDRDYFHLTNSINETINRFLEVSWVHPETRKNFEITMEKNQKKKEKSLEREKIYDLTETDHIELERNLIKCFRDGITKALLLIELLREGINKYSAYNPSYQKGKCEIAFDLYKQGKSYPEIAEIIDCSPKQAQSYVRYQGIKVGDPEFIKMKVEENVEEADENVEGINEQKVRS